MPNAIAGLDANFSLTKHIDGIKKAGYKYAIRYYNSNNPSKNLTLGEAQALVKAGLKLGAVWENGYPDHPGYFSHDVGVHDGTVAHHMAQKEIGQPFGTPIYFAVDYDAKKADLAAITAYFQGVRDGFNAISKNDTKAQYAVGAYASGLVCSTLLAKNLSTYSWLTQSTGFNGSKDFAKQKLYNLIQYLPKTVAGVGNVDPDATNPGKDPGLFTI